MSTRQTLREAAVKYGWTVTSDSLGWLVLTLDALTMNIEFSTTGGVVWANRNQRGVGSVFVSSGKDKRDRLLALMRDALAQSQPSHSYNKIDREEE